VIKHQIYIYPHISGVYCLWDDGYFLIIVKK
jgi:hypothetical protein